MFTNIHTKLSLLGLFVSGLALFQASADTDPFNPVGSLTVTPGTVQAGIHTNLDWNIQYPTLVTDIVEIDDDDSITTKTETRVQLRVVGASWSTATTFFNVQGFARIGGTFWRQVFFGRENDINPFHYPIDQVVAPGTRIDVAARGNLGGNSWTSWRWTLSDDPNVVALVNGDPAPTVTAAHSIQNDVETYLTQFLSDDGTIILGPRDVIYLFDFNTFGSVGYDLQDFVCVLTFTETEAIAQN